jgi:hypothetical protein
MRDRCARVQATYDDPAEYQPRIDAAIQDLADEIEKILHPPCWRSPGERKGKMNMRKPRNFREGVAAFLLLLCSAAYADDGMIFVSVRRAARRPSRSRRAACDCQVCFALLQQDAADQ